MFTNSPGEVRQAPGLPSWSALLDGFYEPAGLAALALQEIKGPELPQPYRALLVHSADMTSTLAKFYGETPSLQVFSRERQGNSYKREVLLAVRNGERPVEYGVIRIHLERLPPAARRLILEEERPLGDILNREAIAYLSWPQAFFRLKAHGRAGTALGLHRPRSLYGRRNVLLDGSRCLLAEVIEVLAPVRKREVSTACETLYCRPVLPSTRFAGLNDEPLSPTWRI
jgi:chorismate-pyruvate lyase